MRESICALCGKSVAKNELRLHREVEAMVLASIREEHPEWQDDEGICEPCYEEIKRRIEDADQVN